MSRINTLNVLLVVLPGSLLACWLILVFNPATYDAAVHNFKHQREYTFAEMGTVFGFFLAALIAVHVAWQHHKRSSSWLTQVFFVGFALIAFVVAMEEVQWGQPLLDYAIPETILAANQQNEMTLHNLEGLHGRAGSYYFVFCVGAFVLYRSALWGIPADVWKQWQPHPALQAMVWMVLALAMMKLFQEFFGNPFAPKNPIRWTTEIAELLIAYWSLAFVTIKSIDLAQLTRRLNPSTERP